MSERLAIDGGVPVRSDDFGPPWDLGDEEVAGLTEVIRSGVLVHRRLAWVEELEQALAQMLGVRHVLACTSGTAACHLAVAMLDLEPLDELISAPIGDVATTAGAVLQNVVPIFADVESDTLTLDPNCVEDAITPRTRALMPVHFLGQPAAMDAILEIARRRDLRVIEDCAQAMLSRWDDRLVGTLGDIGAFSLSNKLVVMGQGGFVATNDDVLAERGRLFRDVARRGAAPALWIGTAYLMTDLQAAVGLAQLKKAAGYLERQVAAADRIRAGLVGMTGLHVLGDDPRSQPNRLFLALAIRGDRPRTAAFAEAIRAEGIPVIFPYDEPIYRHPLFAEWQTYGRSGYPFSERIGGPLDYRRVSCLVTEDAVSRTMMVRMNQSFSDRDVDDIVAAFAKVHAAFGHTEQGVRGMTVDTGGRLVVERLQAQGVDVTFGIPAQMNLALFDAFLDEPPLRQVLARHELGAAYMADGYARATGQPGVLNVVGGPGLTNALTGIAAARSASTPMLVLTTTIAERWLGQDRPTTHELPDQGATIDSIASWRCRVLAVDQIGPAIDEAFDRLRTARPRPIVLEFTPDVLAAPAESDRNTPVARLAPPELPDDEIAAAAALVGNAASPVLWVGGGANHAGDEVRKLAERLAAPVFTTDGSRGLLPDSHPLALGASWVAGDEIAAILGAADVVLAVGTAFSAFQTEDYTVPLNGRIVQIDIDDKELGKNLPIALGLRGDARATLRRMLAALPSPGRDAPTRRQAVESQVAAARHAVATRAREEGRLRTLHGSGTVVELLESIRDAIPDDGILTVDSLIGYWVARHYPADVPRSVQLELTLGGLGYALPAAIGARIGAPERPVVALAGDGAFLFTSQELGTAVQEGLPLPIVIYNDNGYGSIRWNQRRRYGRLVAADMVQPDFAALARAFGALGIKVDRITDVGPAIAEAFRADRPTVIEIPLAIEPPYLG